MVVFAIWLGSICVEDAEDLGENKENVTMSWPEAFAIVGMMFAVAVVLIALVRRG